MSPVDNLIKKTFGEGLWNFTVIFDGNMDGLSTIANYALILGFLLWTVQMGIEFFKGMETPENAWIKKSIANLIWLMLLVALLKTPAYTTIVKTAIAKPAEICAVALTSSYIEKFNEEAQKLFGVYGKSKNKAWSFLTATVKGALLTQLIASLVYIITCALIFITPVLQIRLFEYMVYIGPVCLIFSLCEWTRGIARNWLNLILAISWLAFFGSVSVFLFVKSGVINNIAESASWEDIIPVLVYGIICIVMLLLAFPITSFLFNSAGSGLERIAGAGSAIAATTGVVAGGVVTGAAAGTAVGAIMANSPNKTINKAGQWLSTLSKATTSSGHKYGTPESGITELANNFARKQNEKSNQKAGSVPKEQLRNTKD